MDKYTDTESPGAKRRASILDAISAEDISTQGQLVAALRRRGIRATQASISRDVAELGLVKAGGRYRPAAGEAPAADKELPLRTFVSIVIPAGDNLVVVKCKMGSAQQVGLAIDGLARPETVGTIAGDDTVFVAVDGRRRGSEFIKFLRSRIGEAV